jgi:Zn-dependent protease with chaperone function
MATDFFEHQDRARRNTGLLVLYFVLAVILIVVGVYFIVVGILQFGTEQFEDTHPEYQMTWWNPTLFFWVVAGTLGVIASGSFYKTAALSAGGEAVAQMLHGRRLDPDTDDFHERRLLNIVEEMAIASGTPVPPVYVMDHERGINAFAAGYSPNDAVVGVTRGTLEFLDRDELQGVIAHEFSHILNGDMRLNIRLIGILHGILVIALIGYILLRSAAFSSGRSRRGKRDGGAGGIIALGAGLVVIGYTGVFFGKLIKSAVSRQREFLADASAVQFTRNPSGIAGALKKIGGAMRGSRIEDAHAEEASHMFFGNAFRSWFGLLSTHPPLEVRIKRIDPSFDGTFPDVQPVRETRSEQRAAGSQPPRRPRIFPVDFPGMPQGGGRMALDPVQAVALIGTLDADHLSYASRLIESIPDAIRKEVHNPFGARAVVYALLLDADESIRAIQLQRLAEHADPAVYKETQRLMQSVAELPPETRVPLVDLAMPALLTLSDGQYRAFRENVDHLVKADRKIQLFEYVLQRMLFRHLDEHFGKRKRQVVQYYSLRPLLPDCVGLLSSLAHMGHTDQQAAQRAFDESARLLVGEAGRLQMLSRGESGLRAVDQALEKLASASPQIKKKVLTAATAGIATDGQVTVAEGELLRAVADSLDCPLPPLLGGEAPPQ